MRPWTYEAHEAHLAHPAPQAHSEMSMLDCPDDFYRESGSYTAFKKKLVTQAQTNRQADRPTDGWTQPHIEMRGRI